VVEHFLGREEVVSSILTNGSFSKDRGIGFRAGKRYDGWYF